jgi:hypothetical protein
MGEHTTPTKSESKIPPKVRWWSNVLPARIRESIWGSSLTVVLGSCQTQSRSLHLTILSWWDGFFGACDGNFKLRRMAVSSDAKDPSLYDGLAYFVPLATVEKWMKDREGQKQEVCSLMFVML